MKKVILGAAALMIGAISFAQSNGSTVGQKGDNNAAQVDQVGYSHISTVETKGFENAIDVDQYGGNQNNSDVLQGASNAEYNSAVVEQVGDYNDSDIEQHNDYNC
ncbi:hypothetical protein APR41_03090 [Salegentibacter salinarum]|uniref:Curlin n=1 Tax=Salegentibacter salinarum TaxID=447422 RepID=A0A2N0TY39_9FLAO|nr:hypothetical protein [Salegentibacter salinarum]PKD19606.1 hypothetical protein APR41_03090 [Salegentibacter salinarum]SKB42282.1 Curlin associated repeat-containing protein [Salegentibacter salinarum]